MAPKGQSCSPHFQRKTWNDFILIPHFPRNLIPHFLWKTWNGSILIPHFLRNLIPHFSRKTWNGSILIPHFPRNLIPRFLRKIWNGFTLIPHFLRNSTLLKEGLEWFYFNSSSSGMGRARGKKVRKFHFQSQSKAGRIPGEGTSGILWLTHFLLSLPQLFALEWKLPTDWDVPSIYKKIRDKKKYSNEDLIDICLKKKKKSLGTKNLINRTWEYFSIPGIWCKRRCNSFWTQGKSL